MKNIRGLGQPWRHELKLKDALYPDKKPDDITEDDVRAACVETSNRLYAFAEARKKELRGQLNEKAITEPEYDYALRQLAAVNGFAERFAALSGSTIPFRSYFNHELDQFYDWADAERVLVK